MSKHTPGPWRITDRSEYRVQIVHDIKKENEEVADAKRPFRYAKDPEVRRQLDEASIEEMNANALLIVAAPDLLEACRVALTCQPTHGPRCETAKGCTTSKTDCCNGKAYFLIRAALSKALPKKKVTR